VKFENCVIYLLSVCEGLKYPVSLQEWPAICQNNKAIHPIVAKPNTQIHLKDRGWGWGGCSQKICS